MTSLLRDLFGNTSKQKLPTKELNQFKQLLKLIEHKQYKKALKITNAILRSFENHGETLAMRGLLIRSLSPEKKEESYDLVKKGIANDICSYLCWHVYALLLKSDRRYREALSAFRQAHKNAKGDRSLLPEISNLELQVQDFSGLIETRRDILVDDSTKRAHWIGFALAYYLSGDYENTLEVLESCKKAIESSSEDFELSEFLMFKNKIILKTKDYKKAIEFNKQIESNVVDKISLLELRGAILEEMGAEGKDQAQVWIALLQENPENYKYHQKLNEAVKKELNNNDAEFERKINEYYTSVLKVHPKLNLHKRILLDSLKGDSFKKEFESYVIPKLRKGAPALYKEIKSLFADSRKSQTIEQLFLSYCSSLKSTHKLPEGSGSSSSKPEPPSTYLFSLYFLAQFYARSNPSLALTYVDQAISHTPTLLNLYICKANIFKHSGNPTKAAVLLEYSRALDLADRYLNTKSVLYLLRAGDNIFADRVVGLFARETGPDGNKQNNLYEMQCSWYENELGDCWARKGEWVKAKRQYKNILKHFEEFYADQYDFHGYCNRKLTLSSYVDMIAFEKDVWNHEFWLRAARGMVECYLYFVETGVNLTSKPAVPTTTAEKQHQPAKVQAPAPKPQGGRGRGRGGGGGARGSTAPSAPAKASPATTTPAKTSNNNSPASIQAKKDKYLEKASDLVLKLKKYDASNPITHILSFEVFMKRKKYLLALQAIFNLKKCGSNNTNNTTTNNNNNTTKNDDNKNNNKFSRYSFTGNRYIFDPNVEAFRMAVVLYWSLKNKDVRKGLAAPVIQVLAESKNDILNINIPIDTEVEEQKYKEEIEKAVNVWLEAHHHTYESDVTAAKILLQVFSSPTNNNNNNNNERARAVQLLLESVNKGASAYLCLDSWNLLKKQFGNDSEEQKKFHDLCYQKFPLSSFFSPPVSFATLMEQMRKSLLETGTTSSVVEAVNNSSNNNNSAAADSKPTQG